ncbi:DUF2812 domain-containing protein [Thomasclavelia spiroformis]|uniref:DUF2812 domain-containing protein n=1 Tax=Thomasclavelia spiroformis DSM 1552 TaxID=428126 RepID=B1C138_9FIRM|nr:DUF2812 domain-containing protein [Thomasclavelia spiroformis]EDS75093.1 hypothetical protein CLOSPI_00921 [Thomasclavelia spiroformis DSM 1552]
MRKKCYRFFGGLLIVQANWLNKMSEKGYRLVQTGKMLYEFEECKPNQVKYCVEFIGHKTKDDAKDYYDFLEDMGYKVFYKILILIIQLEKYAGAHGLKKVGELQPIIVLLIENC